MSFIDLMANDVWSESDIQNRVQNLIRSRYTAEDELKAARLARKTDATPEELAYVAAVDAVVETAIAEGRQARIDNALLVEVLAYEVATNRLAQYRLADGKPEVTREEQSRDEDGNLVFDEDGKPVMETIVVEPAIPPITEFVLDEDGNPTDQPNPEWPRVQQDDAERDEAQRATIVSVEVLDLAKQRKPPVISAKVEQAAQETVPDDTAPDLDL